MTRFVEAAPAKINLTLEVLGRRADGYHELRSLVGFARTAADRVVLDTSQPVSCVVSGPFAATIAGENLILVTLAKLARAAPNLVLGRVTLEKTLPVAAGIGGGSSDAAAVLRAVQRANPECVGHVDWQGIALSLGADVPICLHNRLAWMTGIGEVIHPLPDVESGLAVVVANPCVPVPADKTARVFATLRAGPFPVGGAPDEIMSGFGGGDLAHIIDAGQNALQAAAVQVVPEIDNVLRELAALPGAKTVRMSGGGPTCFAVFADLTAAQAAALRLRSARPHWWVAASAVD